MTFFTDLEALLKEAVAIEQGTQQAGRCARYDMADVKAIRKQLDVSQADFAAALGTSVDTIKSWESRRRNPTGLAARVLAAIQEDHGLYYQLARQ